MKFHFNPKFIAALASLFASVEIIDTLGSGKSIDYIKLCIWFVLLFLLWKNHIIGIWPLALGSIYLFVTDILAYIINFQSTIDNLSSYQTTFSMPIEIVIVLLMVLEGLILSIFIYHGVDSYTQNNKKQKINT